MPPTVEPDSEPEDARGSGQHSYRAPYVESGYESESAGEGGGYLMSAGRDTGKEVGGGGGRDTHAPVHFE